MVSTFVSQRALDDGEFPQIMKLSANTWNCLKRTTRAGPRRMVRGRAGGRALYHSEGG